MPCPRVHRARRTDATAAGPHQLPPAVGREARDSMARIFASLTPPLPLAFLMCEDCVAVLLVERSNAHGAPPDVGPVKTQKLPLSPSHQWRTPVWRDT